MNRPSTPTSAAIAFLFSAAAVSATPIVIAGAGTKATAIAYDSGPGDVVASGSTSPTGLGSGSVSRTAGQSVATAGYDYSAAGGDVILAHTFAHHIAAGAPNNEGWPYNYEELGWTFGSVTFSLEAGDIGYTYAYDGRMEQQGTSRINMLSSLDDLTAGGVVFMDQGEYFPSTDAYLQSGETHPANGNPLSGSLIAGHTYRFNYRAFTQHWTIGEGEYTNPYGFTPTDAQGHLTLTLSGPDVVAAVPEPGTLALFGLGMGALALAYRRRR